jgi:hypothetical protein
LWVLAAFWSASVVIWQRRVLPRDWQPLLTIVVALYTVLLVTVCNAGHAWTLGRCVFWLAGGVALVGALMLFQAETPLRQRVALWLTACGVAGLLVQIGSEVAAGGLLASASLVVWRWRGDDESRFRTILQQDGWLLAALMAVMLTAWLGGVRYAVNVELHRSGPSHWATALPNREQGRRWLALPKPHPATTWPPHSTPIALVIGLALLLVLRQNSPRANHD